MVPTEWWIPRDIQNQSFPFGVIWSFSSRKKLHYKKGSNNHQIRVLEGLSMELSRPTKSPPFFGRLSILGWLVGASQTRVGYVLHEVVLLTSFRRQDKLTSGRLVASRLHHQIRPHEPRLPSIAESSWESRNVRIVRDARHHDLRDNAFCGCLRNPPTLQKIWNLEYLTMRM